MADDLGHTHPVIHAPVRDVDVRAADAAVGNVDAYFPGAWRNMWRGPYDEAPRTLVVHASAGRFHVLLQPLGVAGQQAKS